MTEDASGADGTCILPYYPSDYLCSGENGKHFNLKTKNTFAKINGWGRIIFSTYSVVETYNSNTILEIIFRYVSDIIIQH